MKDLFNWYWLELIIILCSLQNRRRRLPCRIIQFWRLQYFWTKCLMLDSLFPVFWPFLLTMVVAPIIHHSCHITRGRTVNSQTLTTYINQVIWSERNYICWSDLLATEVFLVSCFKTKMTLSCKLSVMYKAVKTGCVMTRSQE